MRRLAAAAGAALLAIAASAAAGAPPRCRVRVALEPEHAWVGQQVVYDLLILRRRDVDEQRWERPLSFPTFRAEWLPGRAADAPVEADGETYLAYHERRALFPAHPGELQIPEASLRCVSSDGEEIVRIPPASLLAMPLPSAGAPARFDGVVGSVQLTTSIAPARARLGESVRISVLAQGPGDLWRIASVGDAFRALPDVEVFEQPAETARDSGRRLLVRRYFVLDLVPHRVGRLELPEVAIPFFDPETARYREARAAVGAVEVEAREPAAESRPPPAPPRDGPTAEPSRGAARALAAAAATALALLGLLALRRLRRSDGGEGAEVWIRAAEEARARGAWEEAASAAARALRSALLREHPAARALAAEELRARSPEQSAAADAARWLERLEHARFRGDRAALAAALGDPGWGAAVRRLLESGR